MGFPYTIPVVSDDRHNNFLWLMPRNMLQLRLELWMLATPPQDFALADSGGFSFGAMFAVVTLRGSSTAIGKPGQGD